MKEIPGYSGYFADKSGNIYSKKRRKIHRLATFVEANGYLSVRLQLNKRGRTRTVHRLVLETFVGPKPKGACACHFDGVKSHNRLVNLRWASYSENNGIDKMRLGRMPLGPKVSVSKLDEEKVHEIRRLLGTMLYKDIAKRFGVCQSIIKRIETRKIWGWLPVANSVLEKIEEQL